MRKQNDYREYTTVDMNGHPVMIKTGPAKKGVPWEPVDFPNLPTELRKTADELDALYARMVAADAAGNEEEAERLHQEHQQKLKAWLAACKRVLPTKAGKELSLKYSPRRLDYYYRDLDTGTGKRPRKRALLVPDTPATRLKAAVVAKAAAAQAAKASDGNDTEADEAAE